MEATSARGRREIQAKDFFTGLWETSLSPDEILTGVRFPVWSGRSGFAVEEFARRHGDFAIAGATIGVQLDDDDKVVRCGIGLLGLGSTPLRGSVAEDAVIGRPVDAVTAEEVGRLAMSGLSNIPADLQGSADYRSRVGAAMVARAWTSAVRAAETSETEAIHA
jgi:aerobic carbon-monoxide dehydrogenase medium subunit